MSAIATTPTKVVLGTAVVVAIYVFAAAFEVMGWNASVISGWVMAGLVVLLALFSLRRRLSVLPLYPVAVWTELHVFLGWGLIALFFVHIGFAWPSGLLEGFLATLFVIAALTGALGQWLSYRVPRSLADLDEELIFERLPVLRRQLKETAESLVSMAVEVRRDSPLAAFYMERLHDWFEVEQSGLKRLLPSRRRLADLELGIQSLERYSSVEERGLLGELKAAMRKKHELDVTHCSQFLLKSWLFLHVPTAFAMLVLMLVHAAVIHAYRGL